MRYNAAGIIKSIAEKRYLLITIFSLFIEMKINDNTLSNGAATSNPDHLRSIYSDNNDAETTSEP